MRDLTQTETVKLEELIDATSVSAVLDAIALICDEKSEHIMASYSDIPLMKKWKVMGNAIAMIAMKAKRELP